MMADEVLGPGREVHFHGTKLDVHLLRFETFRPHGGYGILAKFDVSIAGVLTIKAMRLRKSVGGEPRIVTARLENVGGFSVEIRKWLRRIILQMAIDKLREAENDLEFVDESPNEPNDDAGLTRMLAGVERVRVEREMRAGA
jgi:hypothetical protein